VKYATESYTRIIQRGQYAPEYPEYQVGGNDDGISTNSKTTKVLNIGLLIIAYL
jgi:hypothetical protein